jgi:hypothetical protein
MLERHALAGAQGTGGFSSASLINTGNKKAAGSYVNHALMSEIKHFPFASLSLGLLGALSVL